MLHYEACDRSADGTALYAREAIVDASEDAGVVNFQIAAEKLGKARHTPGIFSESIRKEFLSPKKLASTVAAEPLTVE